MKEGRLGIVGDERERGKIGSKKWDILHGSQLGRECARNGFPEGEHRREKKMKPELLSDKV